MQRLPNHGIHLKSDSKESWALWDHGAYRLDDPTFDLRSRKKNRIQCNK
jgi:hypothetical protein